MQEVGNAARQSKPLCIETQLENLRGAVSSLHDLIDSIKGTEKPKSLETKAAGMNTRCPLALLTGLPDDLGAISDEIRKTKQEIYEAIF